MKRRRLRAHFYPPRPGTRVIDQRPHPSWLSRPLSLRSFVSRPRSPTSICHGTRNFRVCFKGSGRHFCPRACQGNNISPPRPPSPEYSLRRFKLRTNFCDWRNKQPNFFFVTCFSSWPSFLLFVINSRCFSFSSFTSQSVFSGRSRAIPVWVILFKRNLEMTFILILQFFNSFLICNTLC